MSGRQLLHEKYGSKSFNHLINKVSYLYNIILDFASTNDA